MDTNHCPECGQPIPAGDPGVTPAQCPHCRAAYGRLWGGDLGSPSPPHSDKSEINPYTAPIAVEPEHALHAAGPPPSNTLAWLALAVPPPVAIAECFIEETLPAAALSFGAVVFTSILICIDATRLGPRRSGGAASIGPAGLLLGGILLWIVFYPLAFFRRRRYGGPNFGPASVLIALVFLGLPIGFPLLGPQELPACDSSDVKQLLVEIVRDSPDFKQRPLHLDGHRETRFDQEKQIRYGECMLHVNNETTALTFAVSWEDRSRRTFLVQVLDEKRR